MMWPWIGLPDKRLGESPRPLSRLPTGRHALEEEINAFCRELPRYKRPRKIIFDQVPRNHRQIEKLVAS